jgi:hypothetical protein
MRQFEALMKDVSSVLEENREQGRGCHESDRTSQNTNFFYELG